METDHAERAKEAFVDDDFETAVDLYTQAISLNPQNVDLFADRTQANIKLKNFTEAVVDANKAIELDPLMTKAYLRKGTACFKLEEYHTAKAALEKGAYLAQNDSRFTKLITECDERIAEETSDLHRSSMPKVPVPPIPANASVVSQSSDRSAGNPEEAEQGCSESSKVKEMELFKAKYRHSFYQKPKEVVVTIFAKGVPSKNVSIDFGEQIVLKGQLTRHQNQGQKIGISWRPK